MLSKIQNATKEEISEIVMAANKRYQELFPDWDIITVTIDKTGDKNAQLDNIIATLEHLKE